MPLPNLARPLQWTSGMTKQIIESARFADLYSDAGLTAFLTTRENVENQETDEALLEQMQRKK